MFPVWVLPAASKMAASRSRLVSQKLVLEKKWWRGGFTGHMGNNHGSIGHIWAITMVPPVRWAITMVPPVRWSITIFAIFALATKFFSQPRFMTKEDYLWPVKIFSMLAATFHKHTSKFPKIDTSTCFVIQSSINAWNTAKPSEMEL